MKKLNANEQDQLKRVIIDWLLIGGHLKRGEEFAFEYKFWANSEDTLAVSSERPIKKLTATQLKKLLQKDVDHIPVKDLKIHNVLRKRGLATVGALTAHSGGYILASKGMGPQRFKDLRAALQKVGIRLGRDWALIERNSDGWEPDF